MKIRKYQPGDKKAVEEIHFETGFLGRSMRSLLNQKQVWAELIRYYLDEEPESAFVAVENDKVIGYIVGCLDDDRHNATVAILRLNLKNIFRMPFMDSKDRKYWWSQTKALIRAGIGLSEERRFKTPSDAAHFHINLTKNARRKGTGRTLLERFTIHAKSKGKKIIYASSYDTRLNPTAGFWRKNGFREFSRVPTEFWKTQLPREKIDLVCYIKKI